MIVWVLRDGDDYLTGTGGRVPVAQVTDYAALIDHHIDDFADEAAALLEAEEINKSDGSRWSPVPLDFAEADPEDFVEHFED